MAEARLAAHDPKWRRRFEMAARELGEALGELVVQIEHVGSTAVPGLPAKPTIDVAVGVRSLDVPPDAVDRLARRGYEDATRESRPGERRFRRGSEVPREVIVHVVEWGSRAWTDYLRFRDALRTDSEAAAAYGDLKRRLLDERLQWYSGRDKAVFIGNVLARAPARAYVETRAAEETERLAARLAEGLRPGDVVAVSGELGAGKTTFVRGASRGLGVDVPVTSPTFTIGHRYAGSVAVSHLDFFRFEGLSDEEWGDLEPYFEDGIVFVEWPENARGALPEPRLRVRLEHAEGVRRLVTLESAERALLERVQGARTRL